MEDYVKAKVQRPLRLSKSNLEKWTPPPAGLMKLNVDDACRSGYGTGLGGVL